MLISKLFFPKLLVTSSLLALASIPVAALEKGGMPDIGQEEQTCLPTSTANLIVWFGKHGYPKLIVAGDSEDDNYIHTVHALITATQATYQSGTRTDIITYGIKKYISNAGYSCDVEYRGIDWTKAVFTNIVQDDAGTQYKSEMRTPDPFTKDWLQENDDPNKGFILLLAYCTFNEATDTFSNALNAGHAVTLVNAEPDMILIHDPAHYSDETGRKILTPQTLTGGTFQLPGYRAPVSGLLLLSGSLLEAPPEAGVMLTGAVCITMHPNNGGTSVVSSASGTPNATIGGSGGATSLSKPGTPAPATAPVSESTGWASWLFDLLFKK